MNNTFLILGIGIIASAVVWALLDRAYEWLHMWWLRERATNYRNGRRQD